MNLKPIFMEIYIEFTSDDVLHTGSNGFYTRNGENAVLTAPKFTTLPKVSLEIYDFLFLN